MSLLWEVDFIQDERRRRLDAIQPLRMGLVVFAVRVVAGTMLAVALAIALSR